MPTVKDLSVTPENVCWDIQSLTALEQFLSCSRGFVPRNTIDHEKHERHEKISRPSFSFVCFVYFVVAKEYSQIGAQKQVLFGDTKKPSQANPRTAFTNLCLIAFTGLTPSSVPQRSLPPPSARNRSHSPRLSHPTPPNDSLRP